jgi:hypothetical protein
VVKVVLDGEMKRIEVLVRSSEWTPAIRKEFFEHLEKRMKDDARVGYCSRKAGFLLRSASKRNATWALELCAWALETFPDASKSSRALALAEASNALQALGKKKEADKTYRAAKKLDPTFA